MNNYKPTLNLEGARNNLHLSHEDVAQKLGISTKTYIDYEKYRKNFRTDKAFLFAKMLGQPFDSLIFLKKGYETIVENKHMN